MASGVYRITCMPTDEFYVGSSSAIERRWWEHRTALNRNRHHCGLLQAAWNTHGEDAFVFEVLEDVPRDRLAQVEDMYLAQVVTTPLCFNTALSAMNPPSLDPAVAARIGVTLKARFRDPTQHPRFGATLSGASRAKISANRKGKAAGEAHYRYGQTVSAEVRKKIGDTQRGQPKAPRSITPEGRAKIAAAAAAGHYSHWQGRQHTDEAKAKMMKRVLVTHPDGSAQEYPSLSAVLTALGLKMPTLRRALLYGRPLQKGPRAGYRFQYGAVPLPPTAPAC
jgi:group I intron endonuclease